MKFLFTSLFAVALATSLHATEDRHSPSVTVTPTPSPVPRTLDDKGHPTTPATPVSTDANHSSVDVNHLPPVNGGGTTVKVDDKNKGLSGSTSKALKGNGVVSLASSVWISADAKEGFSQGFTIGSEKSTSILIRVLGPTLGSLGVANFLVDPVLTIRKGTTVVATNSGFSPAADLSSAMLRVGATPLIAGGKDAAIVLVLQPGAYTVTATSKSGGSGRIILELFNATQ